MEKLKEKTSYYDKKPVLGEPGTLKIREHFKKGFTAFLIVAACIICYFAFLRFDYISRLLAEVLGIIQPITYGLVLAYLLNPVVKTVEKPVNKFLKQRVKNEVWVNKTSRGIGIFSALIFACVIVSALVSMLIPELFKSIRDLVFELPGQIQGLIKDINEFQSGNKYINQYVDDVLEQVLDSLEIWMKTDLLSVTNELMSNVTAGVIGVVSGVFDVIVGVIVSIYVLNSKEQFLGQSRKMVYALMSPKKANMTIHIARKSNEIFGGFIIGKIIDSAIIGVLCFIGVTLLKMPYAVLVSVFVGVTNVIPYFGPFIGAIPTAILILIVDPMKGLYFILFILLLQQFDGNILGPTILGDSTGLSAFWVLFSILLFGGIFGVLGMIIGVPTFAVLYYIIKLFIDQKLSEKNLPTQTECYTDASYVDNDGNYVQEILEENVEEKGE